MLNKYPETMSVDSFLQAQSATSEKRLEFVLGDAVQQRNLLGDLMN